MDFLLTLARATLFASYISRDILVLRLIAMIGMCFNLTAVYIAGVNTPGMKGLLIFAIFAFMINLYEAIRIIHSRRPIVLEPKLKEIYSHNFVPMTRHEFLQFYNLAKHKKMKHGEILSLQDEPVDSLMLIVDGYVKIISNNSRIRSLGSNYFIGEMSLLTGENATATVIVESDNAEVLTWSRKTLEKMKDKKFHLYHSLLLALSKDLIKKIHKKKSKEPTDLSLEKAKEKVN